MNKDLTLKRQLGYIEELKRCANEDCDFYLEHNEAYEFYNYIKDLQNNWNELKKWLEEEKGQWGKDNSCWFESVLDKMQELEGNNETGN